MNRKYGIIAAVTVLVVAIVAVWMFFHSSTDSAASSLPSNITAVAKIDVKSLAVEYGADSEEVLKLIGKVNDGEPLGVDWMKSAYLFSSDYQVGMILPISDADEFVNFLEGRGLSVESHRGLRWTTISSNVLLGFSDKRAMLMGPALGDDLDYLRNTIYDCLRQKTSESGKETSIYKIMESRDQPISLAVNLGTLPDEMFRKYLPLVLGDFDMQVINVAAGMSLKRDKVELQMALVTDDKAVKKALDKADDVLSLVEGKLRENVPDNYIMNLEFGIDGDDLLKLLRKNPAIRTSLLVANAILDVDMILKSIDGDVSITALSGNTANPDVLVMAELDNDKFMKNIQSWNDGMTRQMGLEFYAKDAKNGIFRHKDGSTLYFSTSGNMMAVSSNDTYTKAATRRGLGRETKGEKNLLCASLNLKELFKAYPVAAAVGSKKNLDLFDCLVLCMPSVNELQLELKVADGKELLKELNK